MKSDELEIPYVVIRAVSFSNRVLSDSLVRTIDNFFIPLYAAFRALVGMTSNKSELTELLNFKLESE